jgi:hypothetical protein
VAMKSRRVAPAAPMGAGAAPLSWFEPPRGVPGSLLWGLQKSAVPHVPRRRMRWVRRDRQGLLFLIIATFRAQGRLSKLSATSGH